MKACIGIWLLVIAALAAPAHAGAIPGADIDPRFRAKIVKEKTKMRTLEAERFDFMRGGQDGPDAPCGSQNIGNVDTGGKIGRGPREVFVFAPNAINFVDGRGCR